jgi:hypothetical protein
LRWKLGRIRRLEEEMSEARADQADIRQRLQLFEMIAAAAGSDSPKPLSRASRPGTPSASLPASLLAAARDARTDEEAVWLEVGDSDMIAIVGGPGNPREWWSAIWRVSKQADNAS